MLYELSQMTMSDNIYVDLKLLMFLGLKNQATNEFKQIQIQILFSA